MNVNIMKSACLVVLFLIASSTLYSQNNNLKITDARKELLNGHLEISVDIYSRLVMSDLTNMNLLAEYSYALALSGTFDCALMNLDRVRMMDAKSSVNSFFASLTFSLMGYDDLAKMFLDNVSKSNTPKWISSEDYLKFLVRYAQGPLLNRDSYPIALKRVSYLAASGLYLQSAALYEEIIRTYPSEYLPRIGYSVVLEKLGFYQMAIDQLEMALAIIGDDPELLQAKETFGKQKARLSDMAESPQTFKNRLLKLKSDFNPQTMLYVGGMVMESSISVDSRFGLFLTNTFNGAVDLGVVSNSDEVCLNFGLSGYKRFGVLVLGEGLNLRAGAATVVSLKSSLGLSFIGKKGNSSWDIFFDWYLPLSSGKTSYGISIGKTVYFGVR